jgi:hypothetical protein
MTRRIAASPWWYVAAATILIAGLASAWRLAAATPPRDTPALMPEAARRNWERWRALQADEPVPIRPGEIRGLPAPAFIRDASRLGGDWVSPPDAASD